MFRMKRTFCSALLVLSVLSLLLPLPAAAGGFDETVVTVSWEGVWTALLDRLGLLSVLEATSSFIDPLGQPTAAPPASVTGETSSYIDPLGQPTLCDCSSFIDPDGRP
ncbi:MAG TPA: hypothetical protein DD490_35480 [Acidobacteria bacterium]|nr:hypothetical protein [Acidobacteriota bacterium]